MKLKGGAHGLKTLTQHLEAIKQARNFLPYIMAGDHGTAGLPKLRILENWVCQPLK